MVMSEVPIGACFRVVRVMTGREVGKRLADMGFTEGAEGTVVRGGFMNGPFQIKIRGYDVLIRCSEAEQIEVTPVGEWKKRGFRRRIGGLFGSGFGRRSGKGFGNGPGRRRSGRDGGVL